MQTSVFDLVILSPLEIDSLPFEGIMKLLSVEEFLGREWFQHVDLSAEQVLFSLKRMLAAGFITCHADSTVGGAAIQPPPLPFMKECWYELTPSGTKIIQLPVPWCYEVSRWTFPAGESKLTGAIDELRRRPLQWVYEHTSSAPASAHGLRGWTSHHAIFSSEGEGNVSAHAIDRLNVRLLELLQGHFRPAVNSLEIPPEVQRHMEGGPLTNVDRMVLDVLQDDIESVPLVMDILNYEDAPYRKWHFGQAFSNEEVGTCLAALVEKGYVVAYEEVAEPTVRLVPLGPRCLPEATSLWFGLSAAGRERASSPWPWEED